MTEPTQRELELIRAQRDYVDRTMVHKQKCCDHCRTPVFFSKDSFQPNSFRLVANDLILCVTCYSRYAMPIIMDQRSQGPSLVTGAALLTLDAETDVNTTLASAFDTLTSVGSNSNSAAATAATTSTCPPK